MRRLIRYAADILVKSGCQDLTNEAIEVLSRVTVHLGYVGDGYGYRTAKGIAAKKAFEDANPDRNGIPILDETYSEKGAATMIDILTKEVMTGASPNNISVVFWASKSQTLPEKQEGHISANLEKQGYVLHSWLRRGGYKFPTLT